MTIGRAKRSTGAQARQRPSQRATRSKTSSPTSKASFALQLQNASGIGRRLFLCLDYGTKTLAIAYWIGEPGDMPSPFNIMDVRFSDIDYFAPQKVAWDAEGNLYWGYHVQEAKESGKIVAEDIIELWKLCLYPNHRSSALVEAIYEQLGEDLSIEDLIATHLKHVISEALDYIKNAQALEDQPGAIENLPIVLFLSVPQMWKPPSNVEMQNAARQLTNIKHVELIYEPHSAAGFHTLGVARRIPQQIKAGREVIVADIGGGTGDFVLYRADTSSELGAKIGLTAIKQKGALVGSEFVNQNFVEWLKRQPPNFDRKCKDLRRTPKACIQLATEAFEAIKKRYNPNNQDPELISIHGTQGARSHRWNVDLKARDIEGFFQPIVQEIMACIKELVGDNTMAIISTGGFGGSKYLLDILRREFQRLDPADPFYVVNQTATSFGAGQPVSRGGLMRHDDIEIRQMAPQFSFGYGLVETYDHKVHTDATYYGGAIMADGNVCEKEWTPNDEIVDTDPWLADHPIVHDRWVPLLDKRELQVTGMHISNETWVQWVVDAKKQKPIYIQVYWTEDDIEAHDAIRTGKTKESPMKEGIYEWGYPLEFRLPDLEARGYTSKQIPGKAKGMTPENSGEPSELENEEQTEDEEVYEVFLRLILECNGANIKVRCQMALPGKEPFDEETGLRIERQVEFTEEEEVLELFNVSHNPYTREL